MALSLPRRSEAVRSISLAICPEVSAKRSTCIPSLLCVEMKELLSQSWPTGT